jgi:hypothetical protein
MAVVFQGVPDIQQVSDRIVRITGLSLLPGDSGLIVLAQGSAPVGNVTLPETFQPRVYKYLNSTVGLADSIDVTVKPATSVATAIPVSLEKTGAEIGTFAARLTNDGAAETPELEIYVKFHE